MRSHRDFGRALLAAWLLAAGAAAAALPGTSPLRTSLLQLPEATQAGDEFAEDLLEECAWTPDNRAPVADAGADLRVVHAEGVRLTGSASFDPDGDALTFEWMQTGGPAVPLHPHARVANPIFKAPHAGARLVFRLRVTDRDGAASEDTVVVRVDTFGGEAEGGQAQAGDAEDGPSSAVALAGTGRR